LNNKHNTKLAKLAKFFKYDKSNYISEIDDSTLFNLPPNHVKGYRYLIQYMEEHFKGKYTIKCIEKLDKRNPLDDFPIGVGVIARWTYDDGTKGFYKDFKFYWRYQNGFMNALCDIEAIVDNHYNPVQKTDTPVEEIIQKDVEQPYIFTTDNINPVEMFKRYHTNTTTSYSGYSGR